MKDFVQRTLVNKNNKKFHVLPPKVRESKFCMSKDIYVESDLEITISNTGPQEPKSYNRIYCTHCNSVLLPKLLEKHSDDLGVEKPNLVHLIANWDLLKLPDSIVEYVGCFLPWDKVVVAGPSSRHFIREPCDQAKSIHEYHLERKRLESMWNLWCLKHHNSLFSFNTSSFLQCFLFHFPVVYFGSLSEQSFASIIKINGSISLVLMGGSGSTLLWWVLYKSVR